MYPNIDRFLSGKPNKEIREVKIVLEEHGFCAIAKIIRVRGKRILNRAIIADGKTIPAAMSALDRKILKEGFGG